MALTWILFGVILFLIILSTLMLEWPSLRAVRIAKKIHGLPGLPIVGSIYAVMTMKREEIMDILLDWSVKYPRLTNVYVSGVQLVYVHEPQDVQVILSSVNHIKKGTEYTFVTPWLNDGLLTSYGSKWHARRKLLTPTFHFRILEDSLSTMNASVCQLINKLMATCGQTIEIEDYIKTCALDIIAETAMGISLQSQGRAGDDYVQCVARATEAITTRIKSVWMYKDWIFKMTPLGRTFYKDLNTLHAFTDKVISDRKSSNENTDVEFEDESGRKVRRAFLDCLLETQRTHRDSLTNLDIREEVDTFMFEGHDTVSAALCFTVWLLGHYPEEQEKLHQELKDICGNGARDISMAETHQMVYLEKVIKESLRLYPSVPYFSRRLTEDCVLGDGTVLPALTNCVVQPFFLHRNPDSFPDPEKFDPERFSEENSVGRHPYAYIPFSAGPRNCIGQKFAMLEMKISLAKIFLNLKIKSITRREEFKLLPYLIIRPTKSLQVVISKRTITA